MKYCFVLLMLLMPQLASAHLVSTRFGEFYAGIFHPMITLYHLVPWLALGLLAGTQSIQLGRRAIVAFPLAVMLGTLLGSTVLGVGVEDWVWVRWLNLASIVALGALVVLAKPLPAPLVLLIACFFGISHGLGNSAGDLTGNDLMLYVLGVSAFAYVLTTLLTAISRVVITQRSWGLTAVRALGSWITAIGVLYVGFMTLAPATA